MRSTAGRRWAHEGKHYSKRSQLSNLAMRLRPFPNAGESLAPTHVPLGSDEAQKKWIQPAVLSIAGMTLMPCTTNVT